MAIKLGVSIQTLLWKNIGVVSSLDETIVGKKFKFCLTDLFYPEKGLPNDDVDRRPEQLKALLQIQQWQEHTGCRLDSWTEEGGQRLGFCIKGRFQGITCDSDDYVIKIDLSYPGWCRIPRGKDLAGLPRLQEVALEHAYGVLDDDYGSLTKLTNLTIVHGSVKGTLPVSLAKLENIEVIDLSDNELR